MAESRATVATWWRKQIETNYYGWPQEMTAGVLVQTKLLNANLNAHDDLVAMCDEMAEFLGTQNLYPQYVQDIREQIVTRCRKLLASLEEVNNG